MEIFGGFMVMMSIISLFLAVVWLIMPFVVFAIKGKQDQTLEVLERIEKRLTDLEAVLHQRDPEHTTADISGSSDDSAESSEVHPIEHAVTPTESVTGKRDTEAPPEMQNP